MCYGYIKAAQENFEIRYLLLWLFFFLYETKTFEQNKQMIRWGFWRKTQQHHFHHFNVWHHVVSIVEVLAGNRLIYSNFPKNSFLEPFLVLTWKSVGQKHEKSIFEGVFSDKNIYLHIFLLLKVPKLYAIASYHHVWMFELQRNASNLWIRLEIHQPLLILWFENFGKLKNFSTFQNLILHSFTTTFIF